MPPRESHAGSIIHFVLANERTHTPLFVPRASPPRYNRSMRRIRIIVVLGVITLMPGIAAGAASFQFASTIAPHLMTPRPYIHSSELAYGGVVVAQTHAPQALVVAVHSKFNGGTHPMRFLYDQDTEWYSMDYVFKDGVVVERRVAKEAARPLPAGAFLLLNRAPFAESPLRADSIMLLRRTEL